ncbi:MAG: ATPase [Bacteroidetes bacterium]|nr:MAG: ATPase [Bacteroidota bacterium]
MLKRIAITGPESTGKSWLAKELAKHFNTVWVPEYAREYLEVNGPEYDFDDIVFIAKGQKEREESLANVATNLLFCDTEPLVTKIWSEVVFNKCDPWIEFEIKKYPYDLYLLCYPDIAWDPDILRENPDNRLELFELYVKEMKVRNLPYTVIRGQGKERLKYALNVVSRMFNHSTS